MYQDFLKGNTKKDGSGPFLDCANTYLVACQVYKAWQTVFIIFAKKEGDEENLKVGDTQKGGVKLKKGGQTPLQTVGNQTFQIEFRNRKVKNGDSERQIGTNFSENLHVKANMAASLDTYKAYHASMVARSIFTVISTSKIKITRILHWKIAPKFGV